MVLSVSPTSQRLVQQRKEIIGTGQDAAVPPQLDGISGRDQRHGDHIKQYSPINWHWFKHWGTGEALNNGTHSIDLCRWALGVDYPNSASSVGGRYHFKDDWQFPDTLVTSFDYGDKMISWEGKSCNGMKYYDHDAGLTVMGTTGSVFIYGDGGSGYEVYDLKGTKQVYSKTTAQPHFMTTSTATSPRLPTSPLDRGNP